MDGVASGHTYVRGVLVLEDGRDDCRNYSLGVEFREWLADFAGEFALEVCIVTHDGVGKVMSSREGWNDSIESKEVSRRRLDDSTGDEAEEQELSWSDFRRSVAHVRCSTSDS